MKIFGISFHIRREPGPWSRLSVIEESLAGHDTILHTVVDRLVLVEKKAEATRRKVYRDEEPPAVPDQAPPGPEVGKPAPVSSENIKPGDPVGPDYLT